ncbi:hypothetical protein VTO73DRAFT_430 [Trametes versicolor]
MASHWQSVAQHRARQRLLDSTLRFLDEVPRRYSFILQVPSLRPFSVSGGAAQTSGLDDRPILRRTACSISAANWYTNSPAKRR